jgi:ABC-type bacteriocin/lantibiotic exporter with double-glycine peptidase domain
MKKSLFIIIFFFFLSFANASEFIISNVPFYPSEDNQCGPTSMAMVLNFLGIKVTPAEISKAIYSKGAGGTSDFDMMLHAKKLGLKSENYKGSLLDLKSKIKRGIPLIVMVDEGFWFYKKYHYMVVFGFNEKEIIVHSGKNEMQRIKIETFIKKWEKANFWTFLIYKGEKNGNP